MLFGASAVFAAPAAAYAEPDYSVLPEIIAPSALLVKMDTGEVLYEKDADAVREPASMTKMMTGLLAIEALPPDQVVVADWEVQNVNETQISLRAGEEISVDNLLYATLAASANDAAVALAKAVSGSVADFAVAMNARAQEIGTVSTNFVNPNGLHHEEHVSTARDLVLIARECMQNERFRQYAATAAYLIPETNRSGARQLDVTNKLLWDTEEVVTVYGETRPILYEGTTGIKTGFTYQAGACIIASAERDGIGYIAVVMGDEPFETDVYADAITLFEYAFNGYRYVTLFEEGCSADIPVARGESETVRAVPLPDGMESILLKTSDAEAIRYEYEVPEKFKAPVEAGTEAGVVRAFLRDRFLGETGLALQETVLKEPNLFEKIGIATQDLSLWLKLGALVIFVLVIIFIAVMVRHTVAQGHYGRQFKWGGPNSHLITRVKKIK